MLAIASIEANQMTNKIIIYTKPSCQYCVRAKTLLEKKGLQYAEVGIGSDLTKEEFLGVFPEVRSVPFILIDGVKIGGYDKLIEWLGTRVAG